MDEHRFDQLAEEVARKECREDGKTREQTLQLFREWVVKNPDIQHCRTDDSFLLRFLRVRKFGVLMAQQTLINFLRLQQRIPEVISNLDSMDPVFNDVLSCGYAFVSPFRENNGRRVVIASLKNLDLKKYHYTLSIRIFPCVLLSLMESQLTQVFGVTYVVDYKDVSPALFAYFPLADMLNLTKSMEKCFPIRNKEIHILNLTPVAVSFLNLFKAVLSEKMRSRVMIDRSLEELHSRVDPKALPKEYGGTMPMAEMIDLWKQELAARREEVLATSNIKLSGESLSGDLGPRECGIADLPGTFRKLDVD